MDIKGYLVYQVRLKALDADAKGYLVHCIKLQGGHHKVSI